MIEIENLVFHAYFRPTGEDIPAPSGSKYANKYEMAIDKKGHKTLSKVGKTNIYNIIQESLEGTKIENIIKRIMGGDYSDIKANGIYADVTEMPKSLMEVMNLNIKLENEFMKLPVEERAKFNHNVGEYIKNLDKILTEKEVNLNGNETENKDDTGVPNEPNNQTKGV